jgi:Spy/CpxP family protein refolding chaperone
MNTRILLLICLLSLPAAPQFPGMFPWWDSPVAKDLNLTDEQNAKIRDIVRETRTPLIQQRANLEAAEGELSDQMDQEQFDASKANDAVEKVLAARGELSRTVSQMSLKLRQVLTAQQWRELQKRQPRPGFRGEGRGPGGGPPPFDRPGQPRRQPREQQQ